MNPVDARSAAITLAARRLSGSQGPLLSGAQAPASLAEALEIQQQVSAVLNDGIGGWKCGMPGEDKLVLAPIYTSMVHHRSPCPVWLRNGVARVEPELAFVFDEGLPLRRTGYQHADVQAAITRVHLALELIDSRFEPAAQPTFLQSLADGLVNQGLLLGPEVAPARAFDCVQLPLTLEAEGQSRQFAGVHPAGNPLLPLYWLISHLAQRGEAILPGQAIITGSYAGVIEVPAGQPLQWQFGELASWNCELQPR